MDVLIRDLPDSVHAELARRAAAAGKSLTAYVREVLSDHTRTPSIDEWLERVEALPAATGVTGKTGADWVAEARSEAGDDPGPGAA